MPHSRRYRYTVKVLTPLHIGSGESIPESTYHVSNVGSDHYVWTLLNLEAAGTYLFSTYKTANPSLESVAQFARERLEQYSKYQLKIDSKVALSLRRKNILEHIKLHGKPYLPGSSLKGAIRTAVLNAFLSQGKQVEFEKILRESLEEKDIKKQRLTEKAEATVWSKGPQCDPLRILRIGDSTEIAAQDSLTISEARVTGFHIKPGAPPEIDIFWERLGKKESWKHLPKHLSTPHNATPTFLETLTPGTCLEGELSFNTFLLEEQEVQERLNFREKSSLLVPEQLIQACQNRYQALFQQELFLFRVLDSKSEGQFTKVVEHLMRIQEKETLLENEFTLQLSWGTGWRAKTVADQINQIFLLRTINTKDIFIQDTEDRPYALADFQILPSSRQIALLSPKTRRLVMEGDTPVYPLGWVKVSLQEA